MTIVLDKDGNQISVTNRNGKIRHLLQENKAKIISKNPFTIQLLYDVELKEIDIMKDTIIISNNQERVKNEKLPIETTKTMSYGEFMGYYEKQKLLLGSDTTIYFEVSGLSSEMYSKIIPELIVNYNITVNYFNLDTSFIQHNVVTFTDNPPRVVDRKDEISIQISKEIKTYSNVQIVYGDYFDGEIAKTKLLINIAKQLTKKGATVDIISRTLEELTIDKVNLYSTFESALEKVQQYKQNMFDSFKLLQEAQVNSVYKLPNTNIESKVLVIDNLDYYIENWTDYKALSDFKDALCSLVRLCRATGILLIVTYAREDSIPSDLRVNLINTLKIDDTVSINGVNITLPKNSGVFIDTDKYTSEPLPTVIFNIDDISNISAI